MQKIKRRADTVSNELSQPATGQDSFYSRNIVFNTYGTKNLHFCGCKEKKRLARNYQVSFRTTEILGKLMKLTMEIYGPLYGYCIMGRNQWKPGLSRNANVLLTNSRTTVLGTRFLHLQKVVANVGGFCIERTEDLRVKAAKHGQLDVTGQQGGEGLALGMGSHGPQVGQALARFHLGPQKVFQRLNWSGSC